MSSNTTPRRTTPVDGALDLRAALIERIGGYMSAHAIGVAAELGLADLIGSGSRTSEELADDTQAHEPSLRRLLRLLVSDGIMTEPRPGQFMLTEIGSQLRADSPGSLKNFARMFTDPLFLTSWQGLRHTVSSGERAFDHAYGSGVYAYLAGHPETSALFNEAMSEESRHSAAQLAAEFDFPDSGTLVDLGGGDGTLLTAILRSRPGLRGVVFDSASGVAEAPATLSKAGLADRCVVQAGDFFDSVPGGGDLYLIKSVFQDWGDDESRAILRTCRAHMPESATLLIVGTVLPETADTSTPVMFLTDANMMVTTGGRERTESEFRAMLEETGFTVRSVGDRDAGPLSVIQAVPAVAS
ncbi:methyltransferase [Streptomyces anthocyanicus]|uniref:O-methyltransferase, family 2 n=1 Tax=Streptomyces lividans 1326 TaxID=1200984 RepID=A0A7U9DNL5_STRLI|nr:MULTISPECIES: methyltransferase [Streptomyces]EOY45605.1 O-methyltransferase, family 2 [Streptomyces lividans 1326]